MVFLAVGTLVALGIGMTSETITERNSMIKLYTFIDDNNEVIEQVRADNRDQAIAMAVNALVDSNTDCYSETLED